MDNNQLFELYKTKITDRIKLQLEREEKKEGRDIPPEELLGVALGVLVSYIADLYVSTETDMDQLKWRD